MELETGFGNIIIVDNLPVVPREKFEKLEGVIRKIYSQIGLIKDNGLWMPIDPETNKTSGYCFIEFNTPLVILSLPLSSHWLYSAKTFSLFV
jgi:translation initiation factor 3 subunit B